MNASLKYIGIFFSKSQMYSKISGYFKTKFHRSVAFRSNCRPSGQSVFKLEFHFYTCYQTPYGYSLISDEMDYLMPNCYFMIFLWNFNTSYLSYETIGC